MKSWTCFVVWIHEVNAETVEEADNLFRQMIQAGNGYVEVEEVENELAKR